MNFQFTNDQQDLIDAAKAVFDGENTVERMRVIAAGDPVGNLWPTFAELGLIGLMASEENGGLAQPLVVMAGVAEAAGYAGLPEPLVEVAGITIPLLERQDSEQLVERILVGDLKVGVISHLKRSLNFSEACDMFLVGGNEDSIWSRQNFEFEEMKTIDPLRQISFSNYHPADYDTFADHHGAVLTAAQLIGLSQRMVDMSVDYAKDRHQFGKPIGSFQAIKHHLANVYTQIEFTRPMVHLAALQGGKAVHTAKIAAIDTAMLAAENAIQVHGGMGYTYEVDLHLFMKRAWALCGEWGDRNHHMRKLEETILDGDAELGPGMTFN